MPAAPEALAAVPARPSVRTALYGIACVDALGAARLVPAVEAMAEAGIRWIQLRLKSGADRQRHELVAACLRCLEGSTVELWIDDRADLAAVFELAGVHLGQRDLPPAAARRVVGTATRIGLSCHDVEQVRAAERDRAVDVVAIGPVFPTRSKADPDPVVGLDGVAAARRATTKTLVAIGGLDADRVAPVLAAGADSAVVLGALCHGDVAANARRLLAAVTARSRREEARG